MCFLSGRHPHKTICCSETRPYIGRKVLNFSCHWRTTPNWEGVFQRRQMFAVWLSFLLVRHRRSRGGICRASYRSSRDWLTDWLTYSSKIVRRLLSALGVVTFLLDRRSVCTDFARGVCSFLSMMEAFCLVGGGEVFGEMDLRLGKGGFPPDR